MHRHFPKIGIGKFGEICATVERAKSDQMRSFLTNTNAQNSCLDYKLECSDKNDSSFGKKQEILLKTTSFLVKRLLSKSGSTGNEGKMVSRMPGVYCIFSQRLECLGEIIHGVNLLKI